MHKLTITLVRLCKSGFYGCKDDKVHIISLNIVVVVFFLLRTCTMRTRQEGLASARGLWLWVKNTYLGIPYLNCVELWWSKLLRRVSVMLRKLKAKHVLNNFVQCILFA